MRTVMKAQADHKTLTAEVAQNIFPLEETNVGASHFHGVGASSGSLPRGEDARKNQDDGLKNEPNHCTEILLVLFQKLDHISTRSSPSGFPYTGLLEQSGIKGVEERILGCLDGNLKILLESGTFDHETINQHQSSTIKPCFEQGVYIHVAFDAEDATYIGIYIGSSDDIGSRVLAHITDYNITIKSKKCENKTPYQKPRGTTSHMKCMHGPGSTLPARSTDGEKSLDVIPATSHPIISLINNRPRAISSFGRPIPVWATCQRYN